MVSTSTSFLPNTCIICGKQRIVVSITQEMVGNSLVTNTETTCPDADCQKRLDRQLEAEKMKRDNAKTPFVRTFGNSKRVQLTKTKTA